MMGVAQMISSIIDGVKDTQSEAGGPSLIKVHPDTAHPTLAWEKLQVKQTVATVKTLSRKTPIHPNKVRFVCVSDTHNRMPLQVDIPDGDILIHAGDFSMVGEPEEIVSFNEWLGQLPHRHKVVIAGNHDMTFDKKMMETPALLSQFGIVPQKVNKFLEERGLESMKEVLTNCIYLEDSETSIYGLRIYGSPWQPWFHDWGFNLERGQPCLDMWNKIPEDIDVLITHGPPIGHGDLCKGGHRAGCVELLHSIQQRIKCKYHIFGHIHEGYGVTTDGHTTYINGCTCTYNYRTCNPPILFDIPLPPGVTKESLGCTELEDTKAEMEDESSPGGYDAPVIGRSTLEMPGHGVLLGETYQLDPTPIPHSSTAVAAGQSFNLQ